MVTEVVLVTTSGYCFWLCYMCVFSFVGWQYGDWNSGRWWVVCYVWYSEDGTGRCGESFEM